MNWYLDVETSGLDPEKEKIITIQYQKLDRYGVPVEDLVILKEWEEGEEEIVKKFHKIITNENVFDFIPVMQNHMFDFRFLFAKFRKYGLPLDKSEIDFLYSIPIVDIHSTLIIMNRMSFKGSGLTSMTAKEKKGDYIVEMYKEKKYEEIEEYIKQETQSFLKALEVLCKILPPMKEKLK
jgi:hypothetical protein